MSVTVDAILQRMIVDAKNYNPTIAISQGTEIYIRFATAASAIWGLYKQMDWTLDQIFPTTMNQESLERYAADRGLAIEGLTASELLTLILSYIRNPASGGKKTDFERWSLGASSSGKALEIPASVVSGTLPSLSAENIVLPHDMAGIAFTCGSGDVGKYLKLDLGESKSVFGIGLGILTNRKAAFSIYSSDNLSNDSWVKRGTITASYWWAQTTFEETNARYWKIVLDSIDSLEAWQDDELNSLKAFGIEIYVPSDDAETPKSAECLANYYGVGTVLMLLSPSSLSMRLCEAVRAKCEEEGPVAPREIYVNVPKETTLSLRVTVSGLDDLDETPFRNDVSKYFADLEPGNLFIPAQITVYVLKNGGTNASIEVSKNGSGYEIVTEAIPSSSVEQFVLGNVVVQ